MDANASRSLRLLGFCKSVRLGLLEAGDFRSWHVLSTMLEVPVFTGTRIPQSPTKPCLAQEIPRSICFFLRVFEARDFRLGSSSERLERGVRGLQAGSWLFQDTCNIHPSICLVFRNVNFNPFFSPVTFHEGQIPHRRDTTSSGNCSLRMCLHGFTKLVESRVRGYRG